MTYDLYIGARTFSSWSYRGWLMLEKFGLPYRTHMVGLYDGTLLQDLKDFAPAKTVPTLVTPEGHVLSDSLAMAETLHERHPDAGFYPKAPDARALCRNLVAEMHSGFMPLRADCPNMISHVWKGFEPSEAVRIDVARIEYLWTLARTRFGADGPWLFGRYSLADVFFAPVAFRITTYGLDVSDASHAYIREHLGDPSFREWKTEADREVYDPFPYDLPYDRGPWPDS